MFEVRKSIERKFWKSLCKVFQRLIDRIKGSNGTPEQIAKETTEFLNKPEMGQYLTRSISNMVKNERVESARSWRDAVMRGSNGRKLFTMISNEMNGPVGRRVAEIISQNVQYIKSVPQEWAEYIIWYAYQQAQKGNRPEAVVEELKKVVPERMHTKLRLIARTECAKANAAIVQARAEMCGIRAYIWRCVKDERSRGAHAAMDGILIFYNDPPNPEALFPISRGKGKPPKPYGNYHAGNTFNCRCYQEPVVDMRFLPDTIKVHDHGKVTTMTRGQIQRKYGNISG